MFIIRNGEGLTRLHIKSDVLRLTWVFEKSMKESIKDFGVHHLYCLSLPGYTWQSALKNTGIHLQTLRDKGLLLTLEINIRGGISSVLGDR